MFYHDHHVHHPHPHSHHPSPDHADPAPAAVHTFSFRAPLWPPVMYVVELICFANLHMYFLSLSESLFTDISAKV